jgi:hypothetical protein
MLEPIWSCTYSNFPEIMKLIFSYLCGLTSAFLLFYIFGRLSWSNYFYFLFLAAEILTIPFLINGLVRNNNREVH